MGTSLGAPWGRRLLVAVILVLVLVAGYCVGRRLLNGFDRFTIEQTTALVSTVDGMRYRVHGAHAGPQEAADTLAELNRRIIDLMRLLRRRYALGAAGERHPERREAVRRLLARYNPDNLAENSPRDPAGDTSYTLDKGAVVALCLRERGPAQGRLHDLDTLTFVALHEMAHIAVDDVDHPPRFWAAFRFLLEEAEAGGVYASPHYARAPRRYCGLTIDYNPRFDPSSPAL